MTVDAQPPGATPEMAQWIAAARAGSPDALGRLLEACRPFLQRIAGEQLDADLRGKVDAADVVQETFLEAQRDFAGFQGGAEEELLAWLRQLLLNNLSNLSRHYRQTAKRDVGREVALDEVHPEALRRGLADESTSPSARAIAREQGEELQRALERLPDHYREAIVLRHREHLSFEAIGLRMGRSAEAARKLWSRAIELLQQTLTTPPGA